MTCSNVNVREIVVEGCPLTVEFAFYKGYEATREDPGMDDEIVVYSVFVDELEVTHLLGSKGFEKIERELYRIYEESE